MLSNVVYPPMIAMMTIEASHYNRYQDFADDVVLLQRHEQMQVKTNRVAAASASVGLYIHK